MSYEQRGFAGDGQRRSMQSESGNDYWSLDHALAQEERISSIFMYGAITFGYLDTGVAGTDLKPNDKAMIPLWLATWLADRNMVEMTLPPYFQQGQRLRLLSDPREADLNSSSPYLYEVGHELLPRIGPSISAPVPAIKKTVLALFISRFLDLVATSQNSRPDQDVSVFTRKLTTFERELFHKGLAHSRDMHNWKVRELARVVSVRRPPSEREAGKRARYSGVLVTPP